MLNPYSLLPLALSAHGGNVDDFEAQQLVAAGLTILQRSAALVRALSGRRAAILLPTAPQFIVALAASEGRPAVLLDAEASPFQIAPQLDDARVGAVFTNTQLAANLPSDMPYVLLDDAPRTARVIMKDSIRDIDLGSHHGLAIEGDIDAPGSTDDAIILYSLDPTGPPVGTAYTHRDLLAGARSTAREMRLTRQSSLLALQPASDLFGLRATVAAPLLAGSAIVTMPRFDAARVAELLATGNITHIVGVPATFNALLTALSGDSRPLGRSALRVALCAVAPTAELQERWFDATRTVLERAAGGAAGGPADS